MYFNVRIEVYLSQCCHRSTFKKRYEYWSSDVGTALRQGIPSTPLRPEFALAPAKTPHSLPDLHFNDRCHSIAVKGLVRLTLILPQTTPDSLGSYEEHHHHSRSLFAKGHRNLSNAGLQKTGGVILQFLAQRRKEKH